MKVKKNQCNSLNQIRCTVEKVKMSSIGNNKQMPLSCVLKIITQGTDIKE